MGKLPAEDQARFEQHYLHCQECIERLELAGSLHRGLKGLAAEELAPLVAAAGVGAWWSRLGRFQSWVMPALLVLALLPSGFLYRQVGRLGDALERADSTVAELEKHRRQVPLPQVNLPIVRLAPSRSGPEAAAPATRLALSDSTPWIPLALDVGTDYPSYRVTLLAGQQLKWQSEGLTPGASGALTIGFHAAFLAPGDYQFRVFGLPRAAAPIFVARLSLRVVRPDPESP